MTLTSAKTCAYECNMKLERQNGISKEKERGREKREEEEREKRDSYKKTLGKFEKVYVFEQHV